MYWLRKKNEAEMWKIKAQPGPDSIKHIKNISALKDYNSG